MSTTSSDGRMHKAVIVGAMVVGLVGGSYGIASAASGGSGSCVRRLDDPALPALPAARLRHAGGRRRRQPWGSQRSDETLLTGDAPAKVKAAAAKEGRAATIVRIETDADGHAAYEAHMAKADGTLVTVYVNKSFEVVGVESR